MRGNATFFGARRGVGPPRRLVRPRCVASRLQIRPSCFRIGLQEGAIRRMLANGKNLDAWSPLSLTAMGDMAELGIRMGTPHMI
jgi:hypothetical protein